MIDKDGLVVRLRERRGFFRDGGEWLMSKGPDALCIEAADEIERLNAVVPRPADECSECGEKVAGWKPMFGSFAPEWWETMREKGIDPSTGHKANCSHASRR